MTTGWNQTQVAAVRSDLMVRALPTEHSTIPLFMTSTTATFFSSAVPCAYRLIPNRDLTVECSLPNPCGFFALAAGQRQTCLHFVNTAVF